MKHEERLQQALLEFVEIATESDEAHRAKVLGEALADLIEQYGDMARSTYPTAKGVLGAILDGKIRHVEIKF